MPKIKKIKKHTHRPQRAGFAVFVFAIFAAYVVGKSIFSVPVDEVRGNTDVSGQHGDLAASPFSDTAIPIAVMFDNSPEARPYHAGIAQAAVVYEALVEGGATRLMGVFAGAPDAARVGPIRSARPYFVEMASGWSAFYWHAGGSPEGLSLIPKTEVTDLNEISGLGPRYFWRDSAIARPHNLFSQGSLMAQGVADFEFDHADTDKLLWVWQRDWVAPEDAALATVITVDFTKGTTFDPSFAYDAEKQVYVRDLAGAPHVDANTGEPFAPSMIIIQRVPAEGYYPSGYDRIILNMQGSGEALYFRNGVITGGTWEKADQDSQTVWLDSAGTPMPLAPGQVWVVVVPGERTVSYE